MKRPFAVIGLLILLAGCASRKPLAPDPFFGKTAISPPGTRSFERREASDPYYAAAGTPRTSSEDHTPATAGVFPDRVASWQSLTRRDGVADVDDQSTAWDVPSEIQEVNSTARREPVFRVMQPRAVASVSPRRTTRVEVVSPTIQASQPAAVEVASPSSWQGKAPIQHALATNGVIRAQGNLSKFVEGDTTRPVRLSDTVIDMRNLPNRGARATTLARRDGNVRLTSNDVPVAAEGSASGPSRLTFTTPTISPRANGSPWASMSSPSRYGHDREYSRLRGRLEYSEVARRWKLRYIPINGETDEFGGSVVLADSTLMAGLNKGDFVEVHGRLATDEEGQWGYAPVYEVARLQPIRQ